MTNTINGISSFFVRTLSKDVNPELNAAAQSEPKTTATDSIPTLPPTSIEIEAENCIDDSTLAPLDAHVSPTKARFEILTPRNLSNLHVNTDTSLTLRYRQLTNVDLVFHLSILPFATFATLISIDLSRNRLSRIPSELINLTLPTLRHLNLSASHLTSFPDLSGMPNLRTLNLSQNGLRGALPDPLPNQTPHLTHLNLAANGITRLPASVARWAKLKSLTLGSSVYGGIHLTAAFADILPALVSLSEIDLFHNRQTAPITRPNPTNSLTHYSPAFPPLLNLHHNQIVSIPGWLTKLTSLEPLALIENLLCLLSDQVATFIRSRIAVLTGNSFNCAGYYSGSSDIGLLRRRVMRRRVVEYEGECIDEKVLRTLGGRPQTPLRVNIPPVEVDEHVPLSPMPSTESRRIPHSPLGEELDSAKTPSTDQSSAMFVPSVVELCARMVFGSPGTPKPALSEHVVPRPLVSSIARACEVGTSLCCEYLSSIVM